MACAGNESGGGGDDRSRILADGVKWALKHNSPRCGGPKARRERAKIAAAEPPVEVLFENDSFAAVCKPVGMLCHPSDGSGGGDGRSLSDICLARFGEHGLR